MHSYCNVCMYLPADYKKPGATNPANIASTHLAVYLKSGWQKFQLSKH